MTFQSNYKQKSYRGPDGLICDQSEAVGSDGIVKSGYSVSISVMAADSATIVRDTPLTDGEQAEARAFQAYVARMTGKPRDDADNAPLATANDEDAAYSAYAKRYSRKGA